MYGKPVVIDFGSEYKVEVFIFCNPDTSDKELEKIALHNLKRKIKIRMAELGIKE